MHNLKACCCHFWVIKYWQKTPNKTRTVSHRALVKTQKASDSFVWASFIVSWFVMSPALTSYYTWIDFSCDSRNITQSIPQSVKSTQRSSLERELIFTLQILLKKQKMKTLGKYNGVNANISPLNMKKQQTVPSQWALSWLSNWHPVPLTRGDNCLDREKMRQVIWSNYCAFCV